jgi:prepilin-type N-terminal cleavage/methylation domain-containing protein
MFSKLFKSEGGFTLVELLVTIAILGLLFGIVTLTLSGITDTAETDLCAAEAEIIQSAIDIYLAVNPGATLTAGTDEVVDSSTNEFGVYIKNPSYGEYSWDVNGVLTAGDCPATP